MSKNNKRFVSTDDDRGHFKSPVSNRSKRAKGKASVQKLISIGYADLEEEELEELEEDIKGVF